MNKGQISIDLLLALVLFLVVIGFLLSYVNNFEKESQNYNNNVSGFSEYIKSYDLVKSLDKSNTNVLIKFNDFNYINKTIIFDSNNNYFITTSNFNCDVVARECLK